MPVPDRIALNPAAKSGVVGAVADVIKLRFGIIPIAAEDDFVGTVIGLHIIIGKPQAI